MRAAWYEKQGPAREVLTVGTMPDPTPGQGEVRIRIAASGINPGDIKKRDNSFGFGMSYPRVIPHSDGAGIIDQVGPGVAPDRIGQRVWCFGAQSYRPFGTAAEWTVVPDAQAVPLPAAVPFEQGACLGIPGITAHRAVHIGGAVEHRTVLVQGAAGSVGSCAVQLAHRAGARVLGTVRSDAEAPIARAAGADEVLHSDASLPAAVKVLAPGGVDHIVEVALAANLKTDLALLASGGSIATYATNAPSVDLSVWPLVFNNVRLLFVGSDDFPPQAKQQAAEDLNAALEAGWAGWPVAERFPLDDIVRAHELTEHPTRGGRVVLTL